MEIFKDIHGYEGMYQVSDLGRVKSFKLNKERILKPGISRNGYLHVVLCNEGKQKNVKIHKLVAMAFLNHKPDGTNKIVVDHLNNIRTDNRLENLQLISNRENCSKDRKGFTSKYTGVSWSKASNKWLSIIEINGKIKHLGVFNSEEEAGQYYQDALKSIEEGTEIKVKKPKTSSKYKGVNWNKNNNKWKSQIRINGKKKYLGYFKCELAAAAAYQKKLAEISK
jgi:hypothetical protein